MIYTIEKANMVAEQLRRFTSGFAPYVAGQFGNLDFWMNEVLEAQRTIDNYRVRFEKMANQQKEWGRNHKNSVYNYCHHCGGKCEFSNGGPAPLLRTSNKTLDKTRRELVNAAYYFLARCYRMGLLNDEEIKEKCDLLGTGIDPNDLKK